MDIRVLRYFVTIAREGSMTGAAKFLHVTQPTLSKQLKDLEEELGKKLFIRSNYSLKLTEEGMLLQKRAEDILEMVDKTKNEFMNMDDVSGGDVYVGSAESDAFQYVAHAAMSLQKRHPNMCYHLFSGNLYGVTERLDRGLDDFGIVVDPVNLSKYHYVTLPYHDRWGIIMQKNSPLVQKDTIQIADLRDIPLIVSRQTAGDGSSHSDFAIWYGSDYEKLNIVATYTLAFNAFIMAREGFGYVIGFDNMIHTVTENNLVFRPLAPTLQSRLHIIWKKYQVFSPAAKLFLDEIQTRFEGVTM